MKDFATIFFAKTIYWGKYVRIYCDGGNPVYKRIPKFSIEYYDKYWGMRGFHILWLGRQIFFSFGKDKNNLYR